MHFRTRCRKAALSMRVLLVLCVALFAGACSSTDEPPSAADWVESNTTVFNKVRSYDEKERQEGISRLRSLGRDEGMRIVYWVLSDPKLDDYRLEVVLARLLAEWRDPRAIPYLLQSMQLPDDGAVRIASEGVLVFGDDPRVVEALMEMLEHEALRDRVTAASVLAKIGSEQAVGTLGSRLRAELDPEVRAQMVIGIIQSKHPRRKAFLVDALVDQDEAIRGLAWNALRRYPDVPPVEYSPSGTDVERSKAVAALRVWLARSDARPKARSPRT